VLAGVGVLRGHRDALVGRLHLLAGRAAVEFAAVRVAAPYGVDLGEVGVGAPVAGVDELEQARAVGARTGAEDAGGGAAFVAVFGQVGLGVGPYVVVLVRLVQGGGQAHRVVQQADGVRERVAEEAGDAQGDVDSGAAQLLVRDRFEARHAA
jgi:hypothetical protein